MGGAIAQELALNRPDLVASLQLHCTWGASDPYTAALFESWGELASAPGIGPVAVWRHMLLWAMTPGFFAASPELVESWLATIAGGPLARVPALVTWGSRDLICRPAHGEALAAALPHAGRRVWEGVGHLPFMEQPGEFAAAVLGALRAVS